jgi:hypothetical protein
MKQLSLPMSRWTSKTSLPWLTGKRSRHKSKSLKKQLFLHSVQSRTRTTFGEWTGVVRVQVQVAPRPVRTVTMLTPDREGLYRLSE